MTTPLPPDWRDQLVALVSGKVPADGRLFAGGPVLGPLEQIEVYRRQYRIRLRDAVREDLIGLALLVPELDTLIDAYLAACPSQSWTLNRLSAAVPTWLAQTGAPLEQIEMARVDRAVQEAFEAADGVALTADDLVTLPPLALAPHVQLLRLSTNVHAVRSAALRKRPAPALGQAPNLVVLFRRERRIRHQLLEPAPFAFLEALAAGTALMPALEGLVAAGLIGLTDLQQSVSDWFKLFATEGWLVHAVPRNDPGPPGLALT